jgi:hypothetical protein
MTCLRVMLAIAAAVCIGVCVWTFVFAIPGFVQVLRDMEVSGLPKAGLHALAVSRFLGRFWVLLAVPAAALVWLAVSRRVSDCASISISAAVGALALVCAIWGLWATLSFIIAVIERARG